VVEWLGLPCPGHGYADLFGLSIPLSVTMPRNGKGLVCYIPEISGDGIHTCAGLTEAVCGQVVKGDIPRPNYPFFSNGKRLIA